MALYLVYTITAVIGWREWRSKAVYIDLFMIGFLFALLAVFTLSPNKASVYDIGNENWHLQSEAYMTVKDGKKLSS